LKIENTSSVTLRVPPSPTGEGYSILSLILQTLGWGFKFNANYSDFWAQIIPVCFFCLG